MRNLHELDRWRITDPKDLGHTEGWDHVSVSRKNRVPNWAEMSAIHRLFFQPDEVAMQLHLPPSQHINVHPFVLHVWRPHTETIPLPPRRFV